MKLNNIYELFKVLGRRKWQYAFAGVLLIASIFFRTLEPKILEVTVDYVWMKINPEQGFPYSEADAFTNGVLSALPNLEVDTVGNIFLMLGVLYMILAVLRGGFMLFASALTASSTEKTIKEMRDRLFGHIQRLPLKYFSSKATGELVQKTTGDVETVRKFMMEQVVELVRLSALFFFALSMMLLINWQLALISVALVPILFVGSILFFKQEGALWEKHEAEADKLNSIVQENLDGIRVVKAFAREAQEMKRFDDQNINKRTIGIKHVDMHSFYWSISDFLMFIQITASIIAGGYFVMNGYISLGKFTGFYTYVMMVVWPLRQVGRIVSQMGMATVAMGRINEILDAMPENYKGEFSVQKLKGDIEFRNVSFKYEDQQEFILKKINLKIAAGEKVAFVGPAGSGKSTLIKLLNRFHEPVDGSIYLDGRPLTEYDKTELRSRTGYVLQKPFLFSTTIKGNVAYTRDKYENKEMMDALQIAHAQRLQDILIDGFESQVGEKGVSLSGGQKQRIALARTLMAQPDLLILDDVTSAVDTETEQSIYQNLQEFIHDKTTIIISHRLTSIQLADRIIVIENGRVTEDGSHQQLIKNKGYYARINELQLGLEEEILSTIVNDE